MPTSEPSPETLWHYTTTGSLISIITAQIIWATDAMYLNDSRELLEGAERLGQEAEAALNEHTPEASDPRRLWLDIHRTFHAEAQVQLPQQGPFVACFCSEGDLLSQWRGYANGTGYAIGFSAEALRSLAKSRNGSLVNINYGPADPNDTSLFYSSTLAVGESGTRLIPDATALAGYKHPAFSEEREWRLVFPTERLLESPPELDVKFRTGMLGVTPYLNVPFHPDAVSEVRIGPGGDQSLRATAVRRMLDSRSIPAITSISAAPFRR